jgi:DNA-binding SARP family transcriptional activator
MDERVVVVEAAAGYGKTVLAAELVDAWRAVGIDVLLHEGGMGVDLLAARVRSAAARAGYRDAAAAMASVLDDASGAIDELLNALAGERCALVFDDVHHAGRDAARLVVRVAQQLQGEQRLIVLARRLPEGAERLRRPEYLQLDGADLALSVEETRSVCQAGFGLDVNPEVAQAVEAATSGWTAATVLAAGRARRTGEDVLAVAEAAGRRDGAMATLLEEALAVLEPGDAVLLAQVARLPLISPSVVDAASGVNGFFQRLIDAGLPLVRTSDEWWDWPGPVRDHLATLAAAEPSVLRRAAEVYARRGQLSSALELLVASDDAGAAAELLAKAPLRAVDALDVAELQAVADLLPADAIDANPTVLLHLAVSYDRAALIERREEVLARAEAIAERTGDAVLARGVEAERANDLVRDSRHRDAEVEARRVLAVAGADEPLTRARALSAAGRAVCWQLDAHGRRDEAALRNADAHLARASRIYQQLGMRTAMAGLVPYRAMWIDYARGDAVSAMVRLDEGLGWVVDNPRKWAYILTLKAEVALELGNHEQCEADTRESLRIGEQLGDDQLQAWAYWQLAIAASFRGDADATLDFTRRAEQHKADWWKVTSSDFLADSADSLDRVGHSALAWEYLTEAQADPKDGEPIIAMAHGALLARHGDPVVAEQVLLAAPGHRIDPREYWRVTLLRAYAAYRRGDRQAGPLAARAFEQAARLGLAQLPLTKEKTVTEELLGLAVETGQPAAVALSATAIPIALSLLGRFELTSGGRPVPLAPGQASQLVKFVAVSGGRVATERATDAIWPEADLDASRNRLRTVLYRLRSEAGEILVRDGESLVLSPDVRVDLALFEAEARRALALGLGEPTLAVAVARSAISRYRGDLLPDDLYTEWAERPREHARRRMLELLDLCADVAVKRGDLDEARRVVELSIDLAPYDEERYLKAAVALLEQGRRGAALSVVARARTALAELGLEPPLHLLRLERSIVA